MADKDSGLALRRVATDHRTAEVKNALREHLRVRPELDTQRCISCTHAHTWSDFGRKTHRRTGLCETCWNVLAKPPSLEKNIEAVNVCDRLKDAEGCEFMSQWLFVTNCINVDQLAEYTKFDADYVSSIISGTVELPDIWRPGCRPDP